MTKNWKDIHYSFTEELETQWTNQGFTYWQVKDWINIGLKPTDASFVSWLEQEGYTALAVLNYEDLQVLRKDYADSLINPRSKQIPAKPNKPWWKLLIMAVLSLIIYYLLK